MVKVGKKTTKPIIALVSKSPSLYILKYYQDRFPEVQKYIISSERFEKVNDAFNDYGVLAYENNYHTSHLKHKYAKLLYQLKMNYG